MKLKGATDLQIATRQRHIMMIISQMKAEGINNILDSEVQRRLLRETGIKVSLTTIGTDIDEINIENTFVKDIASKYYSKMNQQSITNYLFVQQEAIKQYGKSWTQNKTSIKKTPDGTIKEDVTTGELSHPKAEFLRLYMDAEKLIQETLNGKACDISVAMIGSEHKRLKNELEILQRKLEKAPTIE